jgi:hypothetical protein
MAAQHSMRGGKVRPAHGQCSSVDLDPFHADEIARQDHWQDRKFKRPFRTHVWALDALEPAIGADLGALSGVNPAWHHRGETESSNSCQAAQVHAALRLVTMTEVMTRMKFLVDDGYCKRFTNKLSDIESAAWVGRRPKQSVASVERPGSGLSDVRHVPSCGSGFRTNSSQMWATTLIGG